VTPSLAARPPAPGSRARRLQRWLLPAGVLFLLALAPLYFAVRRPILPIDDATLYVTGAQALAQGRGYLMLGVPTEPGNTTYPPGYSLLLAPIFLLQPSFPANLSALQLVSLLTFYVFLAISALTLRRCYRAPAADVVLVLLLLALTPLALAMSTGILSDSLYGVLSLGSVLVLQQRSDGRSRRQVLTAVAGALLAVMAYYTRTAGFALVAALAITALRDARRVPVWRTAVLLTPTALLLPWFAWNSLHGGSTALRQYVHGTPGSGIPVDGPEALLIVVLGNFLLGSDVLHVVGPALVSDDVWPGHLVPALLGFAAATVLFAYLLYQSYRGWRATGEMVHLYVLLYLLATLLLPWRVLGRYLWPLAPIVGWYLLLGLRDLWPRSALRLGWPAWPLERIVVALLLIANAAWFSSALARGSATGWVADAAYQEQILGMRDVAAYLRGLAPADGLLGTNHLSTASWWYLHTGRRGLDAVIRADGEEPFYVRRALQGDPDQIAYFVYHRDNPNVGAGEEDLAPLRAALAARGAPTEPLYCAAAGALCVYDWRSATAPRAPPR
jgi:hypothetical protein